MTDRGKPGQQAFKLKGTAPALTLLYMLTEDLDAVERQLADHLRQMPQFFLYAPIVVDLTEIASGRVDMGRLAELLRRHKLVPVAIRNPTDSQQVLAVSAGWAVLQSGLTSPKRGSSPGVASPPGAGVSSRAATASRVEAASADAFGPADASSGTENVAEASSEPEPPEPFLPGLTLRTPVRSGQVIHAVGGDLVVVAPVSSGAELIADGNIHVYGPLRGRALAGASGNSSVSIFCMSLEAEFVSIAGRYVMADQIPATQRGKPARVHLSEDELLITSLTG
jgi:septum site-determining protein MinC